MDPLSSFASVLGMGKPAQAPANATSPALDSGASTQTAASELGLAGTAAVVGGTALRWSQRWAMGEVVDASLSKLAKTTGKPLPSLSDKLPNPIQKVAQTCEKNAVNWGQICNIKQSDLKKSEHFGLDKVFNPAERKQYCKAVAARAKHNFGSLGQASAAVEKYGLLDCVRRAVMFENPKGLFNAMAQAKPGALVSSMVALSFLGLGIAADAQRTVATLENTKPRDPKTSQAPEATGLEKNLAGAKAIGKGMACWEAGTIGMVAGNSLANVLGLHGWQSKLAGIVSGSVTAVTARSGINVAEQKGQSLFFNHGEAKA